MRMVRHVIAAIALAATAAPVSIPKDKLAEVRSKAAAWMASIDADPVRVRHEKGMKGKKHMVEAMHTYLYLYRLAAGEKERQVYRARFAQLARATGRPEYHNLAAVPLAEFREDSTSYLNACLVMEHFGLDTAHYRAEIKKVLPRILEDVPRRGVNQQIAFRYMLDKLKLGDKFRVDDLIPLTVVRKRKPLAQLSVAEQYDVTHEIFPLGEFGRQKITAFDAADREYLRRLMAEMVAQYTAVNNVDLLAEALVCMRYLDFEAMPEYRKGLDYILTHQNPNGSFGSYERERAQMRLTRPKYDVDLGGYLHTTEVCLWALAEAVKKGASPV